MVGGTAGGRDSIGAFSLWPSSWEQNHGGGCLTGITVEGPFLGKLMLGRRLSHCQKMPMPWKLREREKLLRNLASALCSLVFFFK